MGSKRQPRERTNTSCEHVKCSCSGECVLSKNIDPENDKEFLDFLTIECVLLPDKSYAIKLIFSGDAVIKINTEVIDVILDDQGSPWESKTEPKHNFL